MRLYHFTSSKHGLENISKARVRISRFKELNDPFEFLPLVLSDQKLRTAFSRLLDRMNETTGMVCFSSHWQNPLMWSHYSEKHCGICLGFDVNEKHIAKVKYVEQRLNFSPTDFIFNGQAGEENMSTCLTTKFSHWSYEAEERSFVSLDPQERDVNGNYFLNFGPDLKLRQIIVGANSKILRRDVLKSLAAGGYQDAVEHFKARAAFKEFKIVKNRKPGSWI
jgi:hypothetical protein